MSDMLLTAATAAAGLPGLVVIMYGIASIMTREVECSVCGKKTKLRHGILIEPHHVHSHLDKYICQECALNIESETNQKAKG